MHYPCAGFLELSSITRGIQVTDGLLKKASVKIVFSYPVSSGKHLICFEGEVEDVRSSLLAGQAIGGPSVLDSFILPNIHPQILPAVSGAAHLDRIEALGVLEISTCASCIVAADIALKTSKVRLVKIQLAKGIGGKAYFILEGEVGEVNSAMAAATRIMQSRRGQIVDTVIIPQAATEMLALFD